MANEKRLIDANALKWKLGMVTLYVPWLRNGKIVISKILESYRRAVLEEIDNAPTVDAVEVVRCGQCKHWEQYYRLTGRKEPAGCGECRLISMDNSMNAYDFCSYGERRSNV